MSIKHVNCTMIQIFFFNFMKKWVKLYSHLIRIKNFLDFVMLLPYFHLIYNFLDSRILIFPKKRRILDENPMQVVIAAAVVVLDDLIRQN